MDEPRTFAEAQARFAQFLAQQHYPTAIVWVTSDDVLLSERRQYLIKLPVRERNERHVQELFERTITNQKSILFHTICADGSTSYVAAWQPANHDEACRALMPSQGLKLSAHAESSRAIGVVVQSALHWFALKIKLHYRQKAKVDLFKVA